MMFWTCRRWKREKCSLNPFLLIFLIYWRMLCALMLSSLPAFQAGFESILVSSSPHPPNQCCRYWLVLFVLRVGFISTSLSGGVFFFLFFARSWHWFGDSFKASHSPILNPQPQPLARLAGVALICSFFTCALRVFMAITLVVLPCSSCSGLSICKSIVEMMQGCLLVSSTEGVGSSFSFACMLCGFRLLPCLSVALPLCFLLFVCSSSVFAETSGDTAINSCHGAPDVSSVHGASRPHGVVDRSREVQLSLRAVFKEHPNFCVLAVDDNVSRFALERWKHDLIAWESASSFLPFDLLSDLFSLPYCLSCSLMLLIWSWLPCVCSFLSLFRVCVCFRRPIDLWWRRCWLHWAFV